MKALNHPTNVIPSILKSRSYRFRILITWAALAVSLLMLLARVPALLTCSLCLLICLVRTDSKPAFPRMPKRAERFVYGLLVLAAATASVMHINGLSITRQQGRWILWAAVAVFSAWALVLDIRLWSRRSDFSLRSS